MKRRKKKERKEGTKEGRKEGSGERGREEEESIVFSSPAVFMELLFQPSFCLTYLSFLLLHSFSVITFSKLTISVYLEKHIRNSVMQDINTCNVYIDTFLTKF
jgi:hypothetical protein